MISVKRSESQNPVMTMNNEQSTMQMSHKMRNFMYSSFKFQVSSFICHIHDYIETV